MRTIFFWEYILRRYYDKKRKQSGKQHAADEGRRMPYLHRWQSVMLLHKIKSKIKVSKINGLGPWTITPNHWNTDTGKTNTSDTGAIYATFELKHLWATGLSPNVYQTGCASNIPGETIFFVLMIGETLRQLVTHIPQPHTEDPYWELILWINISRALTLKEQVWSLRDRKSRSLLGGRIVPLLSSELRLHSMNESQTSYQSITIIKSQSQKE